MGSVITEKAAAKDAEEELNQAGREIGVRFEGLTPDEKYLRFRVVDERRNALEEDVENFAQDINKMLEESPSATIRQLVSMTQGFVLE